MTSHSTIPGWLLINLTMVALLVLEPWIPGLSHDAVRYGLASACVLTLGAVVPPPRAFRRIGLIPFLIAAQALCWTLVWQHTTAEHFGTILILGALASAFVQWVMWGFVVVPRRGSE